MKHRIYFLDMQKKLQADSKLQAMLRRCCAASLSELKISQPCEISISFVDDEQIREMNRENRDIDKVTDVLSFPMTDAVNGILPKDEAAQTDGTLILGDIVISLERAAAQSVEYGHSYNREVAFLCVHSMLHLLGFDHMEEAEENRMTEIQKKILTKLGIERT